MDQSRKSKAETNDDSPTRAQVHQWFTESLADVLGVGADTIRVNEKFDRYGLDSSAAIGMTESLGSWLGCELEPTLLYDHPTIEDVSKYLVSLKHIRE